MNQQKHDTPQYNSSAIAKFSNIPQEIKNGNVWVNWIMENRDGKPTKVPLNPNTGNKSAANRPQEWGSFITAVNRVKHYSQLNGIGRMLSADDSLIGLDLDKCVSPDGTISDDALEVVKLFNSYTEISQSGTGLRIFIYGSIPEGNFYKKNPHNKFECYSHNRFLVVTGNALDFVSQKVEHRQKELEEFHHRWMVRPEKAKSNGVKTNGINGVKTHQYDNHDFDGLPTVEDVVEKAKSSPKFAALYSGDFSDYNSQSEADQALCNLLAFWCCGSFELMDACFISSGLYRDKWDREDYKDNTIENAIDLVDDRYDWGIYSDSKLNELVTPVDVQLDRMGIKLDQLNTNHQAVNQNVTETKPEPLKEIASKPRDPRVFVTVDEIMNREDAEWLVEDSFHENVHLAIYGPPASGKSFLALDYALCIATGKPFQGCWDVEQGPVIYVYSEGFSGLKKRLKAWSIHHKMEIPIGNIAFAEASFNLLEKSEAAILATAGIAGIKGQKPKLIVVDTLSRNFQGNDSDGGLMPLYIDNIQKLKRHCNDATAISIHHSGKDLSRGLRGHTSLLGGVDAAMEVTSNESCTVANVRCEKQKEEEKFEPRKFEKQIIDLGYTNKQGKNVTSCVWTLQDVWMTRRSTLKKELLEFLQAIESQWLAVEFENSEARSLCGKSDRTARSYLNQLVEKGFLIATEYGKSKVNPASMEAFKI